MPQICLTCQHPRRKAIELEMIHGVSLMAIAKKYQASYDSIYNHARTHLKQKLLDKAKEEESAHQQKILAFINDHLSSAPQVEYDRLVKAAKDLNQTMGLNPPIDPEAGPVALKEGIRKAIKLIEHGDTFRPSTESVLKEFRKENETGGRLDQDRPKAGRKNHQELNNETARGDHFQNFESISEPYAFDGIDLPSKLRAAIKPKPETYDLDDYIPESNLIPSEDTDPRWLREWRRNNPSGPL